METVKKMKSLSQHINEAFSDKPKLIYHFSYDIVDSDDDYNEIKSELEKIIDDTEPMFNENICGSTIILGYDNVGFNLFEVLENKLKKNIVYCLSTVIINDITKQFQIKDSKEILKHNKLTTR